jgi:hypothetical protein
VQIPFLHTRIKQTRVQPAPKGRVAHPTNFGTDISTPFVCAIF